MSHLRYAHEGLTEEQIGAAGVSSSDRKALESRLTRARDALNEASKRGGLGFLNCPDIATGPFVDFAREKRSQGFTEQVVIGIGGSSLGARAILDSARGSLDGLRTHFAENVDPVEFARLLDQIDIPNTLFIVITKSGSTIETMSKFWVCWDRAVQALGGEEKAANHFVAVTDPAKGALRDLVEELGFASFEVPANVGGRFSVLTAVGLVPLALAGYPIDQLMEGARTARGVALETSVDANPVLQAAADQFLLYQNGIHLTVMMAYAEDLEGLVEWFRQLWAESLGKRKNREGEEVFVGMTPISAIGAIDQHSQVQLYMEGPADKNIIFLEVEAFGREVSIPERAGLPDSLAHLRGRSLVELLHAELQGTRVALKEAGRPTSRWIFHRITPEAVGGFLFSWEYITAIMGELLEINAFDQPGVELGKKIAHGILGREGFEEYAEIAATAGEGGGALDIV